MKLSRIASAVGFAHLLGLASAKAEENDKKKDDDTAKKAEEDDDKQRADESDEDYAKRMEEKDKDTAKKAEDDEKAKKAEDDKKKEDEAKENDDEKQKAARSSERARCARIIAHGIANNCVRQAGVFAFDTEMSAPQAIGALEASAADTADSPRRSSGLRERMGGVQQVNVGIDAGASASNPADPKAQADAIILAGKRRRGEV
jgi:hypothetical protein